MIALDTECTGLDLFHDARPYLVTICDADGQQRFWEWDVDPLTRRVEAPEEDAREIRQLLARQHDGIVLQNSKFDAHALLAGGITDWSPLWELTRDTLIAGHLLHSGQRHDLTSMFLMMCGEDIQPFEDRLEAAVKECRKLVQQARLRVKRAEGRYQPKLFADAGEPLAGWMIAEEGLAGMPSAKGGKDKAERGVESSSPWKFDAWLPRAVAKHQGLPPGHPWWTVCSDYANADSAATIQLWQAQEREIKRRGLWAIFLERMKLPRVTWLMEGRGPTFSTERSDVLVKEFGERSASNRAACVAIAKKRSFDLEMPKGASPNGSLRRFCFDVLDLPRVYGEKSKTSEPSLDKNAMTIYKATLDPATDQGRFVKALLDGRGYDTSLTYIAGYNRHGVPVPRTNFKALHPNFNPTGTDHLRWSCSNPNGQNIPKRDLDEDDKEGKTVRWLFGPAPGREWWSLDFSNIELRIPAFESGEPSMVELFEKPDEPPFWGSYHYLNASIIYPDLFWPLADFHPDDKRSFKSKYKATWYQWDKNFGFALQYRCGEATGDRAAHKAGAWAAVKVGLPKMEALNDHWVGFANKKGWVETLPDRTVDPDRGYPIECSRSENGRISPTVPLNYHISGTAMQATNKAMPRVQDALDEWRRSQGFDGFMALQVHDELVLDFPKGGARNLPKVRTIKALMEESGTDIGIPLKVSVSYHPDNWGEAAELTKIKGAA